MRGMLSGLVAMMVVIATFVFGAGDGPLQCRAENTNKAKELKTVVRDDGPVQGMWAEDARATFGLVTVKADVPEEFQSSLPYVAVYPKADGEAATVPYAISYQSDGLSLQMPRGKKTPRIVTMKRLVALLDAAEDFNRPDAGTDKSSQ